ncbi:MAG: SUMF1/EgtB/PvdO family nonheme iron enzyme, partial [Chloroflexota bacterium]
KVETFLEYCRSSNGLLMLQGTISTPNKPPRKVYAFPHLTFEEYLAARYLADHDPEEYAYELVGKSDRWREAIKLLGEHLCFGSPQRPTMSALLEALSSDQPKATEEEQARMTWLAGELLVLYRRAFPSKEDKSDKRIFAQLRETAIQPLPDPRIRANCADLADELGYLPDDLYDFVRVEQVVNLFYIAKHPVTNLQYERFLNADDFHAEKYWTKFPKYSEPDKNGEIKLLGEWGDEGYQWLQKNWDESKKVFPRYWTDPRFGIARRTAPVVGITWYEANAYCRWLSEQRDLPETKFLSSFILPPSSFVFRLPTETEWVFAAGGEKDNRYPWDEKGATKDEKEILRRANTAESGINRTTPVGMYPLGRTNTGIWDLAGNVWEWQANYQEQKGNWLGLRGGSWGNAQGNARVSLRYFDLPRNLWNYYGFRVAACSPPT